MISSELMQFIRIGPDITKVRRRLRENRDMILTAKLPEKFIQKQIQDIANQPMGADDQSAEDKDKHLRERQLQVHTLETLVLPLLKELLNDTFETLTKTPYDISFFNAYMIEFMFSLENPEHPLSEHYLIIKGGRRATIAREHLVKNILSDQIKAGKAEMLRFYKAEDIESEDYPIVFAFTLRQTDLFLLDEFLHHHGKKFGEGFGQFLQTLIIDQEKNLLPKTIKATEKWIEEKWPCLKREILEAKEADVPKGKIKIQGRLKDHEVRDFFSFLYKVKDKRGRSALSRSNFDVIFENGMMIPNKAPKKQPYKLQLSTDGVSITALQYCIFRFYKLHEPESHFQDINFKRNIARFFVYNFENFGELTAENIERRRKLIRDEKPSKVNFEIGAYFPKETHIL